MSLLLIGSSPVFAGSVLSSSSVTDPTDCFGPTPSVLCGTDITKAKVTQYSRSPSSVTAEIDTVWPAPSVARVDGRCFTYNWNFDTNGIPGEDFKLTIVGDAGGCGAPYPDGVYSLWLTDLSAAILTRLPDSSFTNKVVQSHGVLTATISLGALGLARGQIFFWSAGSSDTSLGGDATSVVTHTLG